MLLKGAQERSLYVIDGVLVIFNVHMLLDVPLKHFICIAFTLSPYER